MIKTIAGRHLPDPVKQHSQAMGTFSFGQQDHSPHRERLRVTKIRTL